MKRSELNRIIESGIDFFGEMKFLLPPYAYWGLEEWAAAGPEYDEIRDNMLGWDITDFGGGDFYKMGLLIFTLRNGNFHDPRYTKPYSEKILIFEENQVVPFHTHWQKREDMINRGGGNLLVALHNAGAQGELLDTPVEIQVDGRRAQVPAGEPVRLRPGESIALVPGQYHKLWGEAGTGRVLLGEVSSVNDDRTDNRFLDPVGRFPELEEDARPAYLIFQDYARAQADSATWPSAWRA